MPAPFFTYSGNVYTGAAAGTTGFGLTSTAGNPIAYLEPSHIHVYKSVNSGATWVELTRPSGWDFESGGTVIRLVTGTSVGDWIKVQRITPTGSAYVTFQSSSLLTAEQLNDDTLFNTYLNQEISDQADQTVDTAEAAVSTASSAVVTATQAVVTANNAAAAVATAYLRDGSVAMTGPVAAGGYKIENVGSPVDGSDAATKAYTDNLVSTSIDSALVGDVIAGDGISITDNAPASGQITVGISNAGVTTAKIADGSITSAKLSDATVLVNAEQASSTPNDTSFFTTQASDSRYFRQDSSETINSGSPWSSSDNFIATTAAIDARVIDLVDDVGGFVPIASETSFPLTNPDINNPDGSGTIISVKEIVTTRTPVSGTVTIANGAGANTVTITGCGSTSLPSGYGVLVETTSTLHAYTFHRLVPKATEVTTVASISANVTTVATNAASVTAVSGSIANVNTAATNIANINSVAGNSANINTVSGSISSVNTVAGNNANLNTVASNIADIQAVAADLAEPVSEIDTVATNIANVNSVGTNIANVNTVAGNNANVNTVAGANANITTVATNIANVNTTATNVANVNNVGNNIANVNTCATNMAAILAAPTQAANAATSATNAANSATAASSLVTTITNLSYLLNWGLITEAAGTSTDYGAI